MRPAMRGSVMMETVFISAPQRQIMGSSAAGLPGEIGVLLCRAG